MQNQLIAERHALSCSRLWSCLFREYQSGRAGDNVGHVGGAWINSDQDGRDNKFTRGGLDQKAVNGVLNNNTYLDYPIQVRPEQTASMAILAILARPLGVGTGQVNCY